MTEAARWDAEYREGRWDFLQNIKEVPRYGVIAAYLRQVLSAESPGSLLDIGCGDGVLLKYLDPRTLDHYVGVDVSQTALDRFRNLPDCGQLVAADLSTFSPARLFDIVLFNEVLFFADDPVRQLNRYRSHISPTGAMIVSLYAKDTGGARRVLDQVHAELTGPGWQLIDHCRLTTLKKGTSWQLYLAR
jgi:2-polyprenyl-6-hydroxyphenyl methylase/3-demethylubiquinone-9 3-methyltransferase